VLLANLIDLNGWVDIPNKVLTREGHAVDTSTNVWHLPYSARGHSSLDFSRILEPGIRWVTKRHVQEKLEVTSTHAGYTAYQDVWREVLRHQSEFSLTESLG